MPAKVFFDTNVLIYALAQDDARSAPSELLLASGGTVSVQVLNEFVSVARRKLKMPWAEVKEALEAVTVLCPDPVAITVDTHKTALNIAQKYRYEIYDALVIAAALEAGCESLLSEDLQADQKIEGKLTIRNPFS